MTTPRRHALISGASIAGPALAYWLNRYGWQTTIIERAPELRLGGQNVDVRGAGREVLRRMNLEDAACAHTTGEDGTRFIGLDGRSRADFPVGHTDTGGATAELEIVRGDLAQLLNDVTRGDTEYVFDDTITALDDGGKRVHATFRHGQEREFDLVVAADGVRSSTRELILGNAVTEKVIGVDIAYFNIPRVPSDMDWWQWYFAPGRRSVSLRPGSEGQIHAILTFVTETRRAARQSPDEQKALLRRVFAGAGWQTERVLTGLDAADNFYYDSLTQIKAARWSRGRMAVVGDAAYCATPMTGMGTSLALVGAYVLAGEIAAHVDLRDAFRGYERVMRPYVQRAQQLPPFTPTLAHPATRLGIGVRHALLGLAAKRPLRAVAGRLFAPPADALVLPDYQHLERLPANG